MPPAVTEGLLRFGETCGRPTWHGQETRPQPRPGRCVAGVVVMVRRGQLFVVGLGPGAREAMTAQALEALRRAEVVIGYDGYFAGIADLVAGKECLALPLTRETDRARLAVER